MNSWKKKSWRISGLVWDKNRTAAVLMTIMWATSLEDKQA